ncbi:hypothetical protein J6590_099345 [Homalodisca vitripennis]|nr:hypothetical protein J6590_086157 [Homalodisca vitripennis]KAG8328896.1 hypothetical protein J6590_099345 [Homalodisca vitripennis]
MGRLQAIFCREVLGTLIAAVFVILASDHAQAIRWLESCKDAFRELGLLTLLCLYILDVVLYCRLKCELTQGSDVHQYETRGRDNFRTVQYRTSAFEHVPSQVGVKLINKLPEGIKHLIDSKLFKSRLKHLLVSKAFSSIEKFMLSCWDEN